MEPFVIVIVLVGVALLLYNMFRSRSRRMKEAEKEAKAAAAVGLSVSRDLFSPETGQRAPLESFHVMGNEARVTFDVPLEEDDEILFDLLGNEAVEVVREKRRTLPMEDVTEIVVFAGREPVREISRIKLPSPGELPPPIETHSISLAHIAHDPFSAPFDRETDHSVSYSTAVDVPEDDLPPLRDELKIPKSLDRGLRALGTDPEELNGPDFVLALLKMFGYSVTEHAHDNSYVAVKNGVATFITTDGYVKGDHPELDDGVIRRFLAEFGSSGAERGMLVTDKYSPFTIHEIEAHQPKIKFITRERVQRFIDSMALG